MSIDYQQLRLDGVYQMDAVGNLMLRIKIPAGVLSSPQAEAVGDLADRFAGGELHLTTRGSIELHRLQFVDLPEIFRRLAAVGLASRGACGGAVRGISCSTTFSPAFPVCQVVARRLNRHFAGNPHFEGLPKKFKIGIDGSYAGARHLIQDLGLVFAGQGDAGPDFDVWCAGGLGREPQAAFLLQRAVPETRLIPLVEAVVRLYAEHTPPGKRLKYLLRQIGEEQFRTLLDRELALAPPPTARPTADGPLTAHGGEALEATVFAGELDSDRLRQLAALAREFAGGFLALTADQNVALLLENGENSARVRKTLAALGLAGPGPEQQVRCRVCPGSHACRMGLAATREVASSLVARLGATGRGLSFAVSGCPNSCSQPQLADVGIVTSSLARREDGSREPRFALYRRSGDGLGTTVREDLTVEALLQTIEALG